MNTELIQLTKQNGSNNIPSCRPRIPNKGNTVNSYKSRFPDVMAMTKCYSHQQILSRTCQNTERTQETPTTRNPVNKNTSIASTCVRRRKV